MNKIKQKQKNKNRGVKIKRKKKHKKVSKKVLRRENKQTKKFLVSLFLFFSPPNSHHVTKKCMEDK